MEEQYIIAILIVVFLIICVWHYRLCHQGLDTCGIHPGKESLHCDCARHNAAYYAWDPQAKIGSQSDPFNSSGIKPCLTRFSGQMPYRHPRAACSAHMYNPFWPPFGSAGAYITTSGSPYIDVPISRMIGDHVPPE